MRDMRQKTSRGGRLSVALLLSAAMAFGGAPAVAIAEEGGVQPEGVESERQLDGDQTSTVFVNNYTDEYSSAQVGGNITIDDNNQVYGARVSGYGDGDERDTTLDVGGDVTVSNEKGYANGIDVDNEREGTTTTVTVSGDVNATSQDQNSGATGVRAATHKSYSEGKDGGDVNVTVGGDVSAQGSEGTRSAAVKMVQEGAGTVSVTVGGTIKGGVDVTYVHDFSKANLTVWKFEGENPSQYNVEPEEESDFGFNDFLKKNINYIIKVADGALNDNYGMFGLAFENANKAMTAVRTKQGTANFKTFSLGNDLDSNLRFTVSAPEGKKVKAVYGRYSNTEGVGSEAENVTLTKDGDTYLLPMGDAKGGIMIYVEYEDAPEEKKEEEKKSEENKEEAKAESATESVKLASTGIGNTKPANVLAATGDVTSMVPAAMMALAGAGVVLAGRKTRKK